MLDDLDPIGEQLFAINQAVKKRGLPDLPEDTLRELVKVLTEQDVSAQPLDPERIADEVVNALQGSVEGGFINDRSGQATRAMQGQMGLEVPQLQSAQLPPPPGSRVMGQGDTPRALSGSGIMNQPAMPGMAQVQHPMMRGIAPRRVRPQVTQL